MTLTANDVTRIAHLARLGINIDDINAYGKDLSNILKLMESMNTLDTTSIPPMAHPLEQTQRLRPDKVIESNQREKFQRCSEYTEAGLYLVPKVIE
jgi:aspartyl-tRNA(Asn)/glutamyl-tRNA(Gln) amidotransferase subunit C